MHMHRRTAMVCLCTCWHPCQITVYDESPESCCLFSKPVFVPVTLPPGILVCPHTMDYFINENLNIVRIKQINYNIGKIRWVNMQSNHDKNIYTVTIVSLQLMPPNWGLSGYNLLLPNHLRHKHYSNTHIGG